MICIEKQMHWLPFSRLWFLYGCDHNYIGDGPSRSQCADLCLTRHLYNVSIWHAREIFVCDKRLVADSRLTNEAELADYLILRVTPDFAWSPPLCPPPLYHPPLCHSILFSCVSRGNSKPLVIPERCGGFSFYCQTGAFICVVELPLIFRFRLRCWYCT